MKETCGEVNIKLKPAFNGDSKWLLEYGSYSTSVFTVHSVQMLLSTAFSHYEKRETEELVNGCKYICLPQQWPRFEGLCVYDLIIRHSAF